MEALDNLFHRGRTGSADGNSNPDALRRDEIVRTVAEQVNLALRDYKVHAAGAVGNCRRASLWLEMLMKDAETTAKEDESRQQLLDSLKEQARPALTALPAETTTTTKKTTTVEKAGGGDKQ
jgi:hypothetical protein